jgi:O-antigen ligase
MKSLSIKDISLKENLSLLILSVGLSIPAILLGENILLAIPLVIVIMLSFILGERIIIAFIIISLFTLVGEVTGSFRIFIQLVDFLLLGLLFLRRFGLNFHSYPQVPKFITYFLGLYFSAMIISATMSKYPFAGIGIIVQQIAFFIVVYVFYSLIKSEKDIKFYFYIIFLVGCILVTFSLAAFSKEGVSLLDVFAPNRPRVSAIISNIEASTNFFVVSFPIIISTILLKKSFKERSINYFLLFYFSLGLIMTMSRSAIIGIIASSAIVFYMLERKRFYQLLSALTFIVLLYVIYEPMNQFLNTFVRIESGMSARDYIWKMSMDMIKDHTIFGIGPGAYKYEMLNYFPYMLDDWWGKLFILISEVSGGANLSHNYFLTLFTDIGILGILTAVALPTIFFAIGIKTIIKYKNEFRSNYYLIIALFAAGSSIIIRNFFNGIGLLYVGGVQTDLPFWLIFSSLIYFYQKPVVATQVLADNSG